MAWLGCGGWTAIYLQSVQAKLQVTCLSVHMYICKFFAGPYKRLKMQRRPLLPRQRRSRRCCSRRLVYCGAATHLVYCGIIYCGAAWHVNVIYPGIVCCGTGVGTYCGAATCRSSCRSSQNCAAIWVLLHEPHFGKLLGSTSSNNLKAQLLFVKLQIDANQSSVKFAENEYDLWHAYFCPPFWWTRSWFDLNFSFVYPAVVVEHVDLSLLRWIESRLG